MTTKKQYIVVAVALILLVGVAAAYTAVFNVGSGTAYEAPDGLTVTTATDHGLNDRNPFVDNQTVYVDGVRFSSANVTSLTVDAFNASGWTNTSNVDATNGTITYAPDGRSNATVGGSPTTFNLADIAADDGAVDLVIDGSTDTTVETSALPADTTIYAVDASSNQIVDVETTNASGYASFTVQHTTGTATLDLGNGVLKQDFGDSDRHIEFVTADDTASPASLVADDGMNATVSAGTTVNVGNAFPFSNTVNLSTTDGQIEFVASGSAQATVAPANIEGTYTNLTTVDASTTAITADPADKAKLTIDGAATDVSWTDYAADDGTVDTVISGPDGTTSDLTYYGLKADTTYTAYNKTTNNPLAVADTDGTGQVTFTIPHSTSTILLREGDESIAPTQSNATPTGDQSQIPTELSVEVGDAGFPSDNVTVNVSLDGNQLSSTEITQNKTITAAIPASGQTGGSHTWIVNATDRFGNVNEQTYTYNVPNTLYIYNVTPNASDQHELLKDSNLNVEIILTGSAETVTIKNTTDGTIDLTGIDPSESYVVSVSADGYYNRETHIESIFDQSSIFMLNDNRTATSNLISIDDRTGLYSDFPVIQVQRVINTSNVGQMNDNGYQWTTIAGDRLGAGNEYSVKLEQNGRYRFKIINREGSERILGEYTAREDKAITLEVGSVAYNFGVGENSYEWTATAQNETGNPTLKFAYQDYTNETSEVTVAFRYRENGTEIFNDTFSNGPYGELVVTEPITHEQFNNHDFEVVWSADRGNETVGATRVIGGQRIIGFGALDSAWVTAGFSLIALLIAFAVGAGISAGAGGLAVAGWMGVAWYIGAVPTEIGAGAILLAFLVAAWTTVNEQQTEVIQ